MFAGGGDLKQGGPRKVEGTPGWGLLSSLTRQSPPAFELRFFFPFIFLSLCFEMCDPNIREMRRGATTTDSGLRVTAVVLFLTPSLLARLALSPWIRSFLPSNEYFWVMQDVLQICIFFFFFIFRSSNGVRSLSVSHGIAWDVLFVDNSLEGLKLQNRKPSLWVSFRLFLRVSFSKGTVSPLTSMTCLYPVPGFEQTRANYGPEAMLNFLIRPTKLEDN